MATRNVTLPDRVMSAAEARATAAGYASFDEYIASLIEADDLPPIEGGLEAELLRGLDGPTELLTPQLLEDVKRRARCTSTSR